MKIPIRFSSLETFEFARMNGWTKRQIVIADNAEPVLWEEAYVATIEGQRNSTPSSGYPASVIRRHPDGFRIFRVDGVGRREFDVQKGTILGKCVHLFWRAEVEPWWQLFKATAELLDGMAAAPLSEWQALADLIARELRMPRSCVYSVSHAARRIRQWLPVLGAARLRDLAEAVTCKPIQGLSVSRTA